MAVKSWRAPARDAEARPWSSHSEDQRHTGFDPSALLGHINSLFGQHQAREEQGDVRPAGQDPYGDPADQQPGRRY
jgi:hypothetical protein